MTEESAAALEEKTAAQISDIIKKRAGAALVAKGILTPIVQDAGPGPAAQVSDPGKALKFLSIAAAGLGVVFLMAKMKRG